MSRPSLVGLSPHDPSVAPFLEPTPPYEPEEDIQTSRCSGADGNGTGHQQLSKMTGGLRYPSCLNDNFDEVFRAVAQGVIEGAAVPCHFDMPTATGIIDYESVTINYQPGSGGDVIAFPLVTDSGSCSGSDVYYDNPTTPTQIHLCPAACNLVKSDDNASISIDFGCLGS